jgi:predicted Zn finger-like uncharacterized protein
MNVSCPECQSVFRVDPARVPGPGIRARCSVCGGIIPITAARSWTDDFATPHDAASLTTSPRPAAVGPTPALAGGAQAADRSPSAATLGSTGRMTPPTSIPRSATPARVPPFAPGRRPTPQGVPPISPAAPVAPAAPRPEPMSTSSMPAGPRPAPSVPQAAASPPRTDAALGTRPASPLPAAPPRIADVPIGAPINRSALVSAPAASPASPPTANRSSAPAHGSTSSSAATGAPEVASTPGKSPINPFLANDPNQKAKRLARALVSDMVAYHPQKRDEGMRAGTLKQLFREEIKKSYEEYVEQIGKEFAESTSHFQDALNDVLAGGKKVF